MRTSCRGRKVGAVEARAEESAEHVGAHNKEAYVGAALGRAHRHEGGGSTHGRSPFARRKAARKERAAAAPPAPRREKARVSVRPHTYHRDSGYLISGKDTLGRKVSIFSRSKAEAERMRDDIKAGHDPKFDSMK